MIERFRPPFHALGDKKYRTILVDPPWKFEHWGKDNVTGRDTSNHYSVMPLEQIKALPVKQLADDDCVLLLWAIDPMLREAFNVIETWGFTYKTVGFYWVKRNAGSLRDMDYFVGLGYWTRANPEQCLLATRGSPKRKAKDVQKLIVQSVREHSRKPLGVHERIERLLEGPYLELFAREQRPGWDVWGNQLSMFNERAVLEGL